jgi:lactate dehydrogenase-like 2-hydroxyacid dehydrogenase
MGRTGACDFWSPSFMVGKQVTGQRLAIVGMGRIGQAMAHNASGLGMDVHHYNRNPLPDDLAEGATYHESL